MFHFENGFYIFIESNNLSNSKCALVETHLIFDHFIFMFCLCQVEVSFLMVGHTHEAVDRFFSFINRCLKNNSTVMTPVQLAALVGSCLDSGQVIDVLDLEFVADWKKWMHGCSEELHDHTGKGSPHHFRFRRDAEDQPVLLRMKHLVSDEQWFPRAGVELVKKVPDGDPDAAPYFPLGRLQPISYLKRLEKTVFLLEKHHYLDDEQLVWWTNFLKKQKEFTTTGIVPKQYTNDSEFRMKFPTREDVGDERRTLQEEEERPSTLTEQDRRDFGAVQRKEPYSGKIMSRGRRNDRAADAELSLGVGSFVMLRNNKKDEPLLFGKVVEVMKEEKKFKVWYYSRTDMTGYKIDGPMTPILIGEKGKKSKTTKWIGEADFSSLLNFDLATTRPSKGWGVVKLTKAALKRAQEAIEECGDFSLGFADDENDAESGDDLDNAGSDEEEDRGSEEEDRL